MTTDSAAAGVTIRYGERWHTRKRAPIHPLSEDEARARHEAGQLYTAILGDGDTPTLVEVNLAEGYVGVRYLEPHGRDGLIYTFRKHGDRLFLSQVDVNTVNDEGKVATSEVTVIKPDGSVDVRRFDNDNGTVATSNVVTTDVAGMWEDIPRFGDYAAIARRER